MQKHTLFGKASLKRYPPYRNFGSELISMNFGDEASSPGKHFGTEFFHSVPKVVSIETEFRYRNAISVPNLRLSGWDEGSMDRSFDEKYFVLPDFHSVPKWFSGTNVRYRTIFQELQFNEISMKNR